MKKLITLLALTLFTTLAYAQNVIYLVGMNANGQPVINTNIIPQIVNDGLFSSLLSKPTTISGYGITDAVSNSSLATTLTSYTTTSALNTALTGYASLSGSYANPAWITSLAWAKISSTPTTVAGYGITDALLYTSPINITSKTANYTIVSGDFAIGKQPVLLLKVDCTAGNLTQTLPSASTFTGYRVTITKTDATANTLTISGLTGDNIIGTQKWSKEALSDGTNWIQN